MIANSFDFPKDIVSDCIVKPSDHRRDFEHCGKRGKQANKWQTSKESPQCC